MSALANKLVSVWQVFIDEGTKAKVKFVNGQGTELLAEVDASVLPPSMGGTRPAEDRLVTDSDGEHTSCYAEAYKHGPAARRRWQATVLLLQGLSQPRGQRWTTQLLQSTAGYKTASWAKLQVIKGTSQLKRGHDIYGAEALQWICLKRLRLLSVQEQSSHGGPLTWEHAEKTSPGSVM